MEFVFERNRLNGSDEYRVVKSEACNCLKSLEMVKVGCKHAQNNPRHSCGVFLQRTEYVKSYEDEWEYEYYYKINCCPICKEEIDINIVEGKDNTEEYQKLKSERDEVHQKAMCCDSKKITSELLKRRDELDEQIDSFYSNSLWLEPDDND